MKKCKYCNENGICSLFTEDEYIGGCNENGECEANSYLLDPENICEHFVELNKD